MTTTSGTTAVPPTGSGRRRRWPWVLATLGVLGAAGYTALALSAGSTTPADTVVGGVQVGGLTHAEALAALRTGLQDKAAAPIPITFADQSIQLDPAVAGLDVDYVKSLDGLTGATFHPVALYERLTGALERDPALRIDTTALRQQLTLATQSIAKVVSSVREMSRPVLPSLPVRPPFPPRPQLRSNPTAAALKFLPDCPAKYLPLLSGTEPENCPTVQLALFSWNRSGVGKRFACGHGFPGV